VILASLLPGHDRRYRAKTDVQECRSGYA